MELPPDRTEEFCQLIQRHWQSSYEKVQSRLVYQQEESDPEIGLRKYTAPAFPEEGQADLDSLRADFVEMIGPAAADKAMEVIRTNGLDSAFGLYPISVVYNDEEVPIFVKGPEGYREQGREVKPVVTFSALGADGQPVHGLHALQSQREALAMYLGTGWSGK